MQREQIREGMDVLGSDGKRIGQVKQVRTNDFLLSRAMARDVYVPFDAIRSIENQRITLNVTSDQVDQMGWEHPPLAA